MKKNILIGVVFVLALATAVVTTGADDGSMFNWYDECGYTCYQWADGSGDCYPCLQCETSEPTSEPSPTPVSTPVETLVPTETPVPSPTEAPKAACNRGIGNGSEDCDPGNSGGKPGSAGEDNE